MLLQKTAACILLGTSLTCGSCASGARTIRVATFNVEDLSRDQLLDGGNTRVDDLCRVIDALDADVLFLNEIATDPEHPEANARLLLNRLAHVRGSTGTDGHGYHVFAASVNTGVFSGHDLDNDGLIDNTPGDRTFGGDCLGFGTYPGQYGMALLVRSDWDIDRADVRTFRSFLWRDMRGAMLPTMPNDASRGWYDDNELAVMPLSSKSHWDVPVRLADGTVMHVLCSHPTPPVFDGPEDRNGRRNHDEIRFWGEYISGAPWIVDDRGQAGGLADGGSFVIVGDLNADPVDGDSTGNPIRTWLLSNPRVSTAEPPRSDLAIQGLDATDTARFGLRADYVLPSADIGVLRSGVLRHVNGVENWPSDHSAVWMELSIPADK